MNVRVLLISLAAAAALAGGAILLLGTERGGALRTNVSPQAREARAAVEKFYAEYKAAFDDNESKRQRLYADRLSDSLKGRLVRVQGYDPVLCAQVAPRSITITGLQRESDGFAMTAKLDFADTPDHKVNLFYVPESGQFTEMECRPA